MTPEVRLAHDIARQFAHLPQPEAVGAVADHIRRFWAPPMVARLVVAVRAEDDPLLALVAGRLTGPG